MKLLRDIASIRAGVPFRREVKPLANGAYRLVQIKDVDGARPVSAGQLVRVEATEVRPHHLLRPGEVLFVARGRRNQAAAFLADVGDAIAGGQLFVIRPDSSVLPEYLAWYLNQPQAQRQIAEYITGSYVPFVPRAALDGLEIALPSTEDQRAIVAVHDLCTKEQELLEAIRVKRREAIAARLQRVLTPQFHRDHEDNPPRGSLT